MGKSKTRGEEELQDYTLLSLYDSLIERVPHQVVPLFQLIFIFFIFIFFC